MNKNYKIVDYLGRLWNVGTYEHIYNLFIALGEDNVKKYELRIELMKTRRV